MKNIKLTKILAFFMAVLMILPMIPTMDLTVFAEGNYDFSGDIGRTATFNKYFPVPVYHELPTNVTNPVFGNQCYQLGYNDFMPTVPEPTEDDASDGAFVPQSGTIDDVQAAMAKITMVIDDWYYNAEYDLLWYKVKVIEGDTVQKLEENPWVFHDKVKNSVGENSLVLGEKYDILQDATFVNRVGYFVKGTIRLYNTKFEVYEYMAPPTEVYVAYSFIYNDEWYYWLAGDGFNGGRFCIVKAEDVSFIFNSIINTKVKLKDLSISVDLYLDPKVDINDFVTTGAGAFDGIYKVTDVYYSVQKNILFYSIAPCEYMEWPEEFVAYTYISADLLEETDAGILYPIVDFTNPAPIMSYTSYVQPRSAIFGARSGATSAVTRASSGDTNALKMDKDVKDNGNGTYTITLEAYTTGTVKVTKVSKPMDIVLVLDQSGSMAYCINCGTSSWNSNSTCNKATVTYKEVSENFSSNTEYYIKNGDNYTRVYYCRTCGECYTQAHSDSWWEHNVSGTRVTDTIYVKSGASHVSRLDALKDAVSAFVTEVNEKAKGLDGQYGTDDDVRHRIAIVGFASQNSNGYNTEILSVSGNNSGNVGVRYNNLGTTHYQNALQDVTTQAGRTMLDNAIDALEAEGATQSNLGMQIAENIYSNNSVDLSKRNRITIMFTDGTPTTQSSFSETVAEGAINSAYTQKNTYGATVYTVGVFDGADASNPTSLPSYTNTGSNRENRYMHLVSSNYPNARGINNGETGGINEDVSDTQSYYMSASSTEALNNIFVAMGENVQGSTPIELDSETVVKDIITPQFTLPANATDVSVLQYDCLSYNSTTGAATWAEQGSAISDSAVTIDRDNHAVDVKGFDFAHNFVAEEPRTEDGGDGERNFRGRKLVIVFTIEPHSDFLGGDGVATNGAESGIYSKGECIANFTPGSVSVPLKDIKTELTEKHIYYGNTVDLTDILDLLVDLEGENQDVRIDVDGVFNAYVDLLYTIKLNDNTIATYYVPAGEVWGSDKCVWTDKTTTSTQVLLQDYLATSDTSFEVTCQMTSINKTSNKKTTAPNSEWVYVYYPTLYFKDSVQKYRDQLVNPDGTAYSNINEFMDAHWDSVQWKHGTTLSTAVTMEGTAPTLSLTFDYATGAFTDNKMNSTKDVPVNVTVKINDVVINDVATFIHMTCSKDNCAYPISDEEFIVHVVGALTTLTIKKVGHNSADPNQTFLFNVVGKDADNNDINVTVTVHEDGSVTIAGLIIGNTYSVTEIVSWSWRYNFKSWSFTDGTTSISGTKNDASITLGESGNVITFTNERPIDKWLDGDSWLDNLFSLFVKK